MPDTGYMPKTQILALGVSTGTFLAFTLSGGAALVYLQNLVAGLPL